jgi:TonB family protein
MGNTFGGEIAQFTIANGDELGFESSVGFRNEQLLCQDLTEKKALPIVEKIKKEKEAQIRADEEKAQEKADAAEKIITLKPLYPLKVIYPTRAWEAKIQGETTVNVCIKVDGQVDSASISQSSGNADLDKAALIAFQQAIYAPHIEKGIATTGCADIGWGFELDENDFKTQRPLAVANPDYFMRKDFDRVMRKNSDLLQSVYQQENDGNSTSGKAIIVHLEIAPSGRVNRANIVASDLNNPKLDSHMLNTIMLFSFSASSNFVSFYGNYKYVFNN